MNNNDEVDSLPESELKPNGTEENRYLFIYADLSDCERCFSVRILSCIDFRSAYWCRVYFERHPRLEINFEAANNSKAFVFLAQQQLLRDSLIKEKEEKLQNGHQHNGEGTKKKVLMKT